MNENTLNEFNNFLVTIKQFVKLVATELPRFKGMAESVEKSADDLRQCLGEEKVNAND